MADHQLMGIPMESSILGLQKLPPERIGFKTLNRRHVISVPNNPPFPVVKTGEKQIGRLFQTAGEV